MLGRRVGDREGLGYLPVETDFEPAKITEAVWAETPGGHRFPAYEIHMGLTPRPAEAQPFAWIDGRPEGIRQGRVIGTYLHGALEDPVVLQELTGHVAKQRVENSYDQLAQWFDDFADTRLFEELYL
jgi:adenosylcobyric acid synthase